MRKLLAVFLLACFPLFAEDLVWFSGCETGDVNASFIGISGGVCNTTRVLNGTYSNDLPSGQVKTPDLGAMAELWVRADCNIDVLPTSVTETTWVIQDSGASPIATLTTLTDSTLDLEGSASSTALSADTWHQIELHYKKGTGSNAEHHLWIDGTPEVTITNDGATADAHFVEFQQFNEESGSTFCDNYAVSTTGRIGDGHSLALRPDADASPDLFESFSAGSTTWTEVDDEPTTDGTGARAPTSGGPPVNQEWGVTTTTIGTINAVQVVARASQGGGGGGTETTRPTSINDASGYTTCTVDLIDDDPDAEGGDWCNVADASNVTTSVDVAMGDPTADPSSGAGDQEMRVCLRKTSQSTAPTCVVDVIEGNTVRVNDILTQVVTQTDCTTVRSANWQFDPAVWDDDTGAAVEFDVTCTPGSGNPTARASGELGSIEWNVSTKSATTHELIANNDNDSQASKSGDLSLTGSLAWYTFLPTGLVQPTSQADLDAYEIGAEQSVAGAPLMDVSDIFLMVDFDDAGAPAGNNPAALNFIRVY